jgi:cytochrome P450
LALKTNDEWKAKRKALAGAFFKEKMILMSESIKKECLRRMEEWV